jgi:aryl-alcohol dehydrogenase-like predicted oxidoreductase
MKYRTLGRTALQVSLVSLGTGGPSNFGQRTGLSFAEQDALVHRALDLGINLFDTAAAYRESESLLGRALADVPRDRYILATKCTPFQREQEHVVVAPEEIERQCEQSLRNLRTDVIDIYQFHGVIPARYHEVVERLYPVMLRLREQGKIRFIGITELFFSDPTHEMLRMAVPSSLWDTVMLKYGILNQAAAREVLPLCQEHHIGVLNMASVRVKLTRPEELQALIQEWVARGLIPAGALPEQDPLGWLVQGPVDSVISAGYKFAAAHPAISTVLTGTANIHHLESHVAAILGEPLPEAHLRRLQELFGHLAEAA